MKEEQQLEEISFADFLKVGIYVGTILSATVNEKARIPAYVLTIDFGDKGMKKSSAQLTENYELKDLIGQQVMAVLNFPTKRVAGVKSEVLVLAVLSASEGTVLMRPDRTVENGSRIL